MRKTERKVKQLTDYRMDEQINYGANGVITYPWKQQDNDAFSDIDALESRDSILNAFEIKLNDKKSYRTKIRRRCLNEVQHECSLGRWLSDLLEENKDNILAGIKAHTHMETTWFQDLLLSLQHYIQSVPGGKVNILGGHSIGHSKQKCLYEHVPYS